MFVDCSFVEPSVMGRIPVGSLYSTPSPWAAGKQRQVLGNSQGGASHPGSTPPKFSKGLATSQQGLGLTSATRCHTKQYGGRSQGLRWWGQGLSKEA